MMRSQAIEKAGEPSEDVSVVSIVGIHTVAARGGPADLNRTLLWAPSNTIHRVPG
jgi:hypothetical protein